MAAPQNIPINGQLTFAGSLSGQVSLTAQPIAGNLTIELPAIQPIQGQVLAATSLNGFVVALGWANALTSGSPIALSQLMQSGAANGDVIQWNGTAWVSSSFVPGSGTVTSVSSGNATPLFTVGVATPTTTPAFTYTLSNAPAHSYFGNNTAAPAAPGYFQPAFTDISGVATSAQLPAATAGAQGAVQLDNDLGGTAALPTVVSTHLAAPLPVLQGGTGVAASTGTVAVVLSTSPTLVTPNIGAATATSISGLTAPVAPNAAGGTTLGSAALPFSSAYIGAAATNNIQITGTATAARVFTLPDANSNPVQPSTAPPNEFATAISSAGVISYTQPSFANLSGSIALAQTPLTILGDTLYVNATPALARLAGNITTVKQYLSQTGTGTVSAAPAWAQIAAADLSNGTTGTGGAIVLATSPTISAPTISGHPTIEGVTSTGATGTGAFVFATSPSLVTPALGVATATSLSTTTGISVGSTITSYNAVATAGNGVSAILAATSQKSETAADAALLSFTPPASAGSYRVRFVLSVSAATAATLGWTLTYTDSNGNAQTPANLALTQSGTAAPALTFTTSAAGNYYGYADIDINNAAVAIVVKLTFSGTSFAAKASATIERVI